MSDAGLAVQRALYQALDAALSVPVLDYVPPGQATPYVTIGDITTVEDGTKTEDGQEHTANVHVWTQAHRGRKAARDLMSAIYDALHNSESLQIDDGGSPPVASWGLVMCKHEYAEVNPDPDGITMHGVTRFRIVTQG